MSVVKITFAVICLAIVYATAGFVVSGSGLHDQIVPLWVPAGIGLAAIIRFGWSMLPGVFFGNLLFNLLLPFSHQHHFTPEMLFSASMIATGAMTHAASAGYLIRRFNANPLQPQKVRGLLKFVLFAGFLTCTLSASIGSSAVYLITDNQGAAGFWKDWLSWWMGDSFGAILVTPLLLAVFEWVEKRTLARHLRLITQLTLVIISVVVVNHFFLLHLSHQLKREFRQDVKILDAQLQAMVQQNLVDLHRLGQAFSGTMAEHPDQFRRMVLEIQQHNPAVLAYSWDPIVPQDRREAFELHTRELLQDPSFAVYGDSLFSDDPLVPVQLVEPLENNRAALGFNLLSLEDRRRWVIKAQELGRPIATQIINLTQAPDEPGMLVLQPVYQLSDHDSPLMGNKQLIGFVVGVFTIQRLVSSAVDLAGIDQIAFELYERSSDLPFFSTYPASLGKNTLFADFDLRIAQQVFQVRAAAGSTYFSMNQASNAQLMQTLLVLLGCMGSLLVLSMHDRERQLTNLVQQQTQTLAHQARHDPLTGLPNRFMLMERVEQHISTQLLQPFSLLFIDLDRFKMVNDSLGHQIGDQLLQTMALSLVRRMVDDSELFRTGGDEFILMVQGSVERGLAEADRFLNLCTIPVQVDGHKLQMTASIGVSHYPDQAGDLDTLIKYADTAMYKAKAQGKNCVEVYSRFLTEQAINAFHLEQDLRMAIDTHQLLLHYQPQFQLHSGKICGLEVLVRWQHPEKGLLLPGKFIALAEETNLIVPLGWQVIELACQQIVKWQEKSLMVPPVAINISPKQLLEANFIEQIDSLVDRYGIAHNQLELEITEGLIMQDPDYVIEKLNQLRDSGYRLAIDDFGTGYSSLNRLKQLPLDRLKIDYSFTRDIGKNPKDEAIIMSVIALGKSLNIEVLAEGVETELQRAFLRAGGCDSVQGYLLGRPVAVNELSLRDHTS